MKFPIKTLHLIAQHLPWANHADQKSTFHHEGEIEYTVDELARLTNTTVRNVRAYQDKGILPPPALRGRKGIYNNRHLSRLRVAAALLDRGYSLTSIGDLFDGLEKGMGLEEVVGLESAISSPWGDEEPVVIGMTDLLKMYGTSLTPEAIAKAIKLDLLRPEGTKMTVTSMKTIGAGAELAALGIPLEELLELVRMMRGNVERVANELVKLVAEHVLDPYREQALPPKEELPKIAELIWRLRPLAERAVTAELSRAMELAAKKFLADKLEEIIVEKEDGNAP